MAFARPGASYRAIIVAAALAGLTAGPAAAAPGGILSVLGLGNRAPAQEQVQPAQYGDPQVGQLQEEIRRLNGRIEELGFQMLQMQEQMRQMQEDNEFRFQSLEGGAPAGGDRSSVEPSDSSSSGDFASSGALGAPTAPGTGGLPGGNGAPGVPGVTTLGNDITSSTTPPAQSAPSSGGLGAPEQTLGTIIFDGQGNLATTVNPPSAVTPPPGVAPGLETASLPVDDPDELYRSAYGLVLAGDYAEAEAAFNDYIAIHPDGGQVADAHFWLGESQYSQGNFNGAAKTFLNAHQNYPEAEKAPEMLLKLGMSLAALENRDTACATYREVLTRYPNASQTVRNKVATEQSAASC